MRYIAQNRCGTVRPAGLHAELLSALAGAGLLFGSCAIATGAQSPVVVLSAAPPQVEAGDSAMLSWIVGGADNCQATGAWSGSKPTSGSEVSQPLFATSTFTLTCTGAGDSASDAVTVAVDSLEQTEPTPIAKDAEPDWIARSTAPGVVYANDFRTEREFLVGQFPDGDVDQVTRDSRRWVTGGYSLRFDILSTDRESSGNWRTYLRPSREAFGAGDEFFVQYRLYVPREHRDHRYRGGGGWKTSIISAYYGSFTDFEVVINNNRYRGYPQGYYRGRRGGGVTFVPWDLETGNLGCGRSPDYRHQPEIDHGPQKIGSVCENHRAQYGGLFGYGSPDYGESAAPDPLTGAEIWRANEWQTLLQRIKVGGFEQPNSTIEVWFAADGRDYTKLFSRTDVHFGALGIDSRGRPHTGFEAIWLTPFDTGKDKDPTRPNMFVNYDQVIVSTRFIPAPGLAGIAPP